MPLIATPATNPVEFCCGENAFTGNTGSNPPAVPCDGQNILAAPVSSYNGKQILTRMQAIRVSGGQTATISWTMIDRNGAPVNFNVCLGSSGSSGSSGGLPFGELTFKLRLREHISQLCCGESAYEYDAVIVDAATGQVQVVLPDDMTVRPGIYFAELGAFGTDADDLPYLLFSNTFYLVVERGLWSDCAIGTGPPTFPEIRLHLRDSSPAESTLLDNIRFADAEIAAAIVRPIQEWNETPPSVGDYNTGNFPYRYHWTEAIAGNMFLMAAEQYRANNLQYSAGGIAVNDQNKEPNYEGAAERRLKTWRDWMRRKKAEINLGLCYGGVTSEYGQGGGYGSIWQY